MERLSHIGMFKKESSKAEQSSLARKNKQETSKRQKKIVHFVSFKRFNMPNILCALPN